MNIKLTAGWFYGALIVALSVWILHSFLTALLAACVTAVASWPLYARFARRVPRRMRRSTVSLAFTVAMAVFVLAPLLFAFGALLTEVNAMIQELAAADKSGIGVPPWLEHVPLAGPWMASRWQRDLAHEGAVSLWAQRTDATALLGWAQSVGQFVGRHAYIILFAILVLFFLYQEGESLARNFRRLLRHHIGERAEGYVDLATRSLRASVNSMLVVALFDGFGSGLAYAIAGVPHAAVWAAITGLFALVPFLGYVAVTVLSLRLALLGATTPAVAAFALGCLVLFSGDKIVRPMIARKGARLHFVWVLMACLGGFEVLGLVGLVIGPVALSLTRELWEQRVRDLPPADVPAVQTVQLAVATAETASPGSVPREEQP
ncbi:MAG TPA: AI-2E family transporter [Casimicrobiaceae bacterium]|nr:AI-2E family transporter [Casimicrobiaceae bacterium]